MFKLKKKMAIKSKSKHKQAWVMVNQYYKVVGEWGSHRKMGNSLPFPLPLEIFQYFFFQHHPYEIIFHAKKII